MTPAPPAPAWDRSTHLTVPDFMGLGQGPLPARAIPLDPPLKLAWRYTAAQRAEGRTWECGRVHLHAAYRPPDYTDTDLARDLALAVAWLAQGNDAIDHSLLVSPEGMSYNRDLFGGNCQFTAPSGRRFTFKACRDKDGDGDRMLLLAVAWN